jgi:MoCo/4Fe-4S cofactor protein with predicted Tat translocation signal
MESNGMNEKTRLDLEAIRQKLAGKTGKRYWRTLEEVADTPEFQLFLEDEFPNRSTINQINRRDLIKFMGASFALAGLTGCRGVFLPEDKVVPYVKQPEELVPGLPLFYASSMVLAGYATGVLVEQHEGRPTKISGNPEHPSSLGALDILSQANVLGLYDPDRPTAPTYQGDLSTWPSFQDAILEVPVDSKTGAAFLKGSSGGAGVRILTGSVTSPTFANLMREFLKRYPEATWHFHEPCGQQSAIEGAMAVYGSPLNTIYDFSKAKVVVSLDSDFFSATEIPGSLTYAREFANGRRVTGTTGEMNRLYAVESTPGLVGIMADHRWPIRASDVFAFATALADGLGVAGVPSSALSDPIKSAIPAIVADLKSNAGSSIVIAGTHQPAEVHALAQAMNVALGNVGKTVFHTAPIEATVVGKVGDLQSLVQDMNSGQVQTIIIIDSNPAYTAPGDLKFATAVAKVKNKIQLGDIEDETTPLMDWHLPLSQSLESWGDAKGHDGTIGIIQPLIAPLNDSRSPIEFMSLLLGKPIAGYDLVKNQAKSLISGKDFERGWRIAVHDGLIKGSAAPILKPASTFNASSIGLPPASTGMEVVFRPDPSIFDGRFANNGWLQELPKPLSKLTWDNAFIISPQTAIQLNVVSDDKVRLDLNGQSVEGPVFVQPGHTDNSVTVYLGYGRTAGGVVATVHTELEGGGFNAYALRTSKGLGFAGGGVLSRLGGQHVLASTQGHNPLGGDRIIDDRDVIRDLALSDFIKKVAKGGDDPLGPDGGLEPDGTSTKEWIKEQNLFPEEVFQYDGPQWGMTIDMNTCIGCNACVIACQSENNIPVVGKEQVSRHREMHWIRIDRYYAGDDANPQATWQPVACVHCEKAPCEPVCPVAATVHSHEGINQMIYNRCVGTRYCSNNCPYKVRRFNYLNYSDNQPNYSDRVAGEVLNQSLIPGPLHTPRKDGIALLKLMNNPDVTVRGRGVMEKCTYCTQRISYARIEAKKAGREIRDGEIVTACQQACPTQTIIFGNVADKNSAVTKMRTDPRSYLLLQALQTRPRTSHLAKLRNPNPEIPNPEIKA